MSGPTTRLGVDIGGTFTDVVLEIGSQQFSTKVLTTYAAPEDAIIEGMQQVCTKANIEAAQIEQIIHGTTLATNALIERRGGGNILLTRRMYSDQIFGNICLRSTVCKAICVSLTNPPNE